MPDIDTNKKFAKDSFEEIARLARNANYIMQEMQEEYFTCVNVDNVRSHLHIINEFGRNTIRADILSDIIMDIKGIADSAEAVIS